MIDEKKGKIKVKIPETSNRWDPKTPGDRLIGKYCKKERQDYRGRKNFLYTIKSDDHPISDDEGFVVIFGGSVLNDVLGKISPGYEVDIVYKGDKPSPDPKRKPKREYDVEVWVDANDPVLKKLYPDGLPSDIQKQIDEMGNVGSAGDDHEPSKSSPTMNEYDASEVAAFIQGVEADVEGKGSALTEINMLKEAKEQCGEEEAFWKLVKGQIVGNYPVNEKE